MVFIVPGTELKTRSQTVATIADFKIENKNTRKKKKSFFEIYIKKKTLQNKNKKKQKRKKNKENG